MSRTERFLDGVVFGYANQALIMATGLWLTPFLLRRLGQDHYGIWLIGLQTLAYLSLFDFGVVALLPRETAYAVGQDCKAGTEALPKVVGRGCNGVAVPNADRRTGSFRFLVLDSREVEQSQRSDRNVDFCFCRNVSAPDLSRTAAGITGSQIPGVCPDGKLAGRDTHDNLNGLD